MHFGIFNLMGYRDNPGGVPGVISDTCEMVTTAEQAGFEIAWFAEHHFTNYSVCMSPLMMAAHAAGRTSRIKLGTGVIVLPLYHPMRVAQEIGLLDAMSNGRAVLGVGTGYQAYEFERYGADVTHKVDIFLEYWKILEGALSEGHVAFSGKYIQEPETVFCVRPAKGMPPVYCTSPHPVILKALSKWNSTPFITAGWRGSPALPGILEYVRNAWVAGGLDGATMPVALQQYVHVTDSATEALEAAERARYVGRMVHGLRAPDLHLEGAFFKAPPLPDEPPLETFRDNLLIGSPEYVAERLVNEIRTLKPSHYNCFFQFGDMPLARAKRSLERFSTEVLPLVEREVGPLSEL
ncbi:LLM class flavin-dependent oxidoreductase [Acetobacter sp. TBRC 12305]|uniref:LLM class flavin-dependent oxidoreductase n=1 Tax=Acetobacter garciniae TaxID=2817435 RepID=A0A939KQJ3_9PROT|nr:LLM class flavin-dependent oxidoreductase [Acetobacter garciniae]MBO1325479.1 LLM class flavin-dependent oxidoreductase [Acetobacter garciniae]MBX0345349.1 LLM class flavin-dependent oxidoreductase [Acetobacter garciniae]